MIHQPRSDAGADVTVVLAFVLRLLQLDVDEIVAAKPDFMGGAYATGPPAPYVYGWTGCAPPLCAMGGLAGDSASCHEPVEPLAEHRG